MAGSATDGGGYIGYPMMRDCTILNIFTGARDMTVAEGTFDIYTGVYGGAIDITEIHSTILPVGTGANEPVMLKETGLDIDIEEDEYVSVRYQPVGGASVQTPYMTIEVAWRLDD
jgi:hypothetical protein